jgi:hypothetical protein
MFAVLVSNNPGPLDLVPLQTTNHLVLTLFPVFDTFRAANLSLLLTSNQFHPLQAERLHVDFLDSKSNWLTFL